MRHLSALPRLAAGFLLFGSAFSQDSQDAASTIRITVNLVQVDAVVTDSKGRQVTDLKASDFELLQDGKPLTLLQAAADLRFRQTSAGPESYVSVDRARMYQLLANPEFGTHTLELRCSEGIAGFAFTFNSCLDPRHPANRKVGAAV